MTISPSSPSKVPRPKSPCPKRTEDETEPEYTPSTRAVEVEIWYMRRGEACRYSFSAALTRSSSEVLCCVEKSRAVASRDDGTVTTRLAIFAPSSAQGALFYANGEEEITPCHD